MADNPRFTITLTLRDRYGDQEPLEFAIAVDEELRISPRAVEEAKLGALGFMDAVISLMKQREFRKALFRDACIRLGQMMAERMEDAEGWHDTGRVEPARKVLGGTW